MLMSRYIEFAETMKVNDIPAQVGRANLDILACLPLTVCPPTKIQHSLMPSRTPWSTQDPDQRQNNLTVAGPVVHSRMVLRAKPKPGRLLYLPKGDLLRRLVEKLEIKSKEVNKALHTYDRNRDDRHEFKTLLQRLGMDLTDAEYQHLLRCELFKLNFISCLH